MTTVTIKGIVHLSTYTDRNGQPRFVFYETDMSEYGHAPIGSASFEFELPAGFSPTGARISILEKERERINAEFSKRVRTINAEIGKLQAIEFEVAP